MENEKLKNSLAKKDKDDSYLFSTSLIFDQNIDKLWLYLRDLSFETSNTDFLDEFKYIKGQNTWTVGNVCSLYWVGVSHIKIKCISINVDRTRKKIKWKFKCDIGISYYKTLVLYRITQNGKTMVKALFQRTEKKNNLIDSSQSYNYYSKLQNDILTQHSNYLKNIKNDFNLYESSIIEANYLDIWKFITDVKIFPSVSSGLLKNIELKGPLNEIGSFVKFYDSKINKTVFLKVVSYDMSQQKKCWTFSLETIGTNITSIPKLTEFKIFIINHKKSQLSILHKFSFNSNQEYRKEFEINKKNIFIKLIKLIEESKKENNIDLQNNECISKIDNDNE